jgi:hypothetical protein
MQIRTFLGVKGGAINSSTSKTGANRTAPGTVGMRHLRSKFAICPYNLLSIDIMI